MYLPNDPRIGLLPPHLRPGPSPLPMPLRPFDPTMAPLDAPVAAPAAKPNLWSKLFGDGTAADPAQANRAGRQGLFQAGLSLLASNGRRPVGTGPTFAQNLAGAFQAGQQGFQQQLVGDEQQRLRAARQQIQQKYQGKSDVQSLQAMFADLISIGDIEGAKPIAEVLKSMGGGSTHLAFRSMKTKQPGPDGKEIDGTMLVGLDPRDGKEVSRQFFPGAEEGDGLSEYQRTLQTDRRAAAERAEADDFFKYTNNVKVAAENWAMIQATEKDALAGDAAAQMSLIFSFMKMQDPGSTVREGEYATAENARGVAESVRNTWNKLMKGEFLTPEQVRRFVGQAGRNSKSWKSRGDQAIKMFSERAKRRGYDPQNIVYDWFADGGSVTPGATVTNDAAARVRALLGDTDEDAK